MPVTVQLGGALFEWLRGHRDPGASLNMMGYESNAKFTRVKKNIYDEPLCTGSGPT